MKGKKKGFLPFLILSVLLPLSWGYYFVIALRNWFYDKGWMRTYIPPVPLVISIGNIVAGGTGKTPVTMLLASLFYEKYPLAILSRGYRSKAEKLKQPVILCEGRGPQYSAEYCGDEPFLFAKNFPKAHVIVGGNRQKASYLASKAGTQVILLDDAMQHRRLARDFDLVVIDGKDPFGQGYFLPRGFLREDIKSLGRADLIILNHVSHKEQFLALKQQIQVWTDAPIVGTNWTVSSMKNLQGEDVGILKGKRAGMFCGIAHPESFRETLEQEGIWVVAEKFQADHEPFSLDDLQKFANHSAEKQAECLLCTEKDVVKIPVEAKFHLPIYWIKMHLEVVEGQDHWQQFMQRAKAKIK